MREILFRGKRKDTKGWVEGFYACQSNHSCMRSSLKFQHFIYKDICMDINLGGLVEFEVDPETVGQYTGLCDNNGEKIFEGDIIRFGENTYQIIFECGSFNLCDKDGEMNSKIGGTSDYCYSLMVLYDECCWEDNSAYDIEIIGNIHDTPELLEGSKG